jgi:hypothetical protein
MLHLNVLAELAVEGGDGRGSHMHSPGAGQARANRRCSRTCMVATLASHCFCCSGKFWRLPLSIPTIDLGAPTNASGSKRRNIAMRLCGFSEESDLQKWPPITGQFIELVCNVVWRTVDVTSDHSRNAIFGITAFDGSYDLTLLNNSNSCTVVVTVYRMSKAWT